MSYCTRSSLPVEVFDWLVKRLSHFEPQPRPGRGGNPGIPVALRLDALWAVLGDGLSYRKAARVVGISKTEVGDSIAMLTPELASIGICQSDGSFVRGLDDLESRCVEMRATGEVVCVDGAGIATQRPQSWANQYQMWDVHHHQHGVHALVVCDVHGDLLWVDGGWPGQCHELDVIERSGVASVLANTDVRVLADRGYRGLARRDGVNVAHPQGSWKGQPVLPGGMSSPMRCGQPTLGML